MIDSREKEIFREEGKRDEGKKGWMQKARDTDFYSNSCVSVDSSKSSGNVVRLSRVGLVAVRIANE